MVSEIVELGTSNFFIVDVKVVIMPNLSRVRVIT